MDGEHFCSGNGSETPVLLVYIEEQFASPWSVSVYKALLVCAVEVILSDVKV